jgi:hypothetical protein
MNSSVLKNSPAAAASIALLMMISAGLGLSGCSLAPAGAVAVKGSALHGTVYGGQQPVTRATLQLYAAGNTGYGVGYNAGNSGLIPSGSYYLGGAPGCVASGSQTCYANVISDGSGSFTITNDYPCPTSTTPVYLVATGGSSANGSAANPNLGLMVALGPCGQLSASTSVGVNELTTVASIWALSPFMTGIANIGTSATNSQGLLNAFAAVNKVINVSNGTFPGPALPANATLPIAKLNTLADILASCINSTGGIAGDNSGCGNLFTAATVNGVAPTDTITAAMNISQHPGSNVNALLAIPSKNDPFQPIVPAASPPTDWTIAINYQGGGLSTPKGVAVDSSGNVWLPNYGNSSVTELSNTGAAVSGSNGYTVGSVNLPAAIAVDAGGNAWVANSATVTEISASGLTGTNFTGGGLSAPKSLGVDAIGDIWIANSGNNSVTEINTSGTLTNYNGAGLVTPGAIAISPK